MGHGPLPLFAALPASSFGMAAIHPSPEELSSSAVTDWGSLAQFPLWSMGSAHLCLASDLGPDTRIHHDTTPYLVRKRRKKKDIPIDVDSPCSILSARGTALVGALADQGLERNRNKRAETPCRPDLSQWDKRTV